MSNPISLIPTGLEAARLKDKATTGERDKVGQEAFLELMITQLKNQDPMKPMENGEFLSQIAQFGTVSGINELQKSFGSLATALQSNQALQASTMVGRRVVVAGDKFTHAVGQPAALGFELPLPASRLRATVYDEAGQIVRRLDLGAQSAGISEITWDGSDASGAPALPGRYSFKVEALIDGKTQAVPTLVQVPVESVSLPRNGESPILNLAGIGAVSLDAVKRVL
jgi:flagellar basal-body rod modification protein FlgD